MRAPSFASSVRRVLAAQAVIALALVALALLATLALSGPAALGALGLSRALGLGYGALLGLLATAATARSVLKSSRSAAAGQGALALAPIFSGLALKFVIVAAGAFAGLRVFGFGPLYVILGYIAMQVGYVWAGIAPDQRGDADADGNNHRDSSDSTH